jgi:flagellin FlaB
MAKANRKVLRDRKGAMGIGTMIIFIATIITAAIAAAVLIGVNQELREKGLEAGEKGMKDFTTLTIEDAYATMDLYAPKNILETVGEVSEIAAKTVKNVGGSIGDMDPAGVVKGASDGVKEITNVNKASMEMESLTLVIRTVGGGSQFRVEDLVIHIERDGVVCEWVGDSDGVEIIAIADTDNSLNYNTITPGDRFMVVISNLRDCGVLVKAGDSLTIKVWGPFGNGDQMRAVTPVFSDVKHWSLERA